MTTALMERISSMEGTEAEEEEVVARNTVAVAYGGGSISVTSFALCLNLSPTAGADTVSERSAIIRARTHHSDIGNRRFPPYKHSSSY